MPNVHRTSLLVAQQAATIEAHRLSNVLLWTDREIMEMEQRMAYSTLAVIALLGFAFAFYSVETYPVFGGCLSGSMLPALIGLSANRRRREHLALREIQQAAYEDAAAESKRLLNEIHRSHHS